MMLPQSSPKDFLNQLGSDLRDHAEWVFVGPMGPRLELSLGALPILAVDGGANYCQNIQLWVGDADSYSGKVQAKIKIQHPTQKDQSDLGLALALFIGEKPKLYHLWGFLGGRKDHELFNLGECLYFLKKQVASRVYFYGDGGKIYYELLSSGEWILTHWGLFSLGCLEEGHLSLTGNCLYPLSSDSPLRPLSSLGLSNEGQGKFHIKTSSPVFLYYPEGK